MVSPLLLAVAPKVVDLLGDVFQSAFPDSAVREQKRCIRLACLLCCVL